MEPKHRHHEIRLRIRADRAVYLAAGAGSLRYALKPASDTDRGQTDKVEFLCLCPLVDFRKGG